MTLPRSTRTKPRRSYAGVATAERRSRNSIATDPLTSTGDSKTVHAADQGVKAWYGMVQSAWRAQPLNSRPTVGRAGHGSVSCLRTVTMGFVVHARQIVRRRCRGACWTAPCPTDLPAMAPTMASLGKRTPTYPHSKCSSSEVFSVAFWNSFLMAKEMYPIVSSIFDCSRS